MSANFLNTILTELGLFFEPIKEARTNERVRNAILRMLGVDIYFIDKLPINELLALLDSLEAAINNLEALRDLPPQTDSDLLNNTALVLEIDKRVYAILQELKKLKTFADKVATSVPTQIKEEFKRIGDDAVPYQLLDLLILYYLEANHELLYKFLQIIGVIKLDSEIDPAEKELKTDTDSNGVYAYRTPYADKKIAWDKLSDALTDKAYFKKLIGLRTQGITGAYNDNDLTTLAEKLFPLITAVLNNTGLYSYGGISQDYVNLLNDNNPTNKALIEKTLQHSLTAYQRANSNEARKGFTLGLVSSTVEEVEVIIYLFGLLATQNNDKIVIGNYLLEYNIESDASFALGTKSFRITDLSGKVKVKANVKLRRLSTEPFILIGDETGTYFKLSDLEIIGFIEGDNKKYDIGVAADFKKASLVLKPFGDGFLKKVIPAKGINIDFDLSIGYSKNRGLYLNESGTLTTQIAVYKTVFGITLETVDVAVVAKDGDIDVYVATTFKVDFSSFKIRIKKPGLKVKKKKAKAKSTKNDWDFGGFDFGFKMPSGIDFGFFSKFLKGGGGVDFDVDFGRYTGFIDLTLFDKIAVKALLVLDTKLPGGKDGYSLVLVIQSVGFTPIQLGLGFSLTGIGGLIGYNRTMDVDALRAGIRNNAIESIFLPGDLVDTAPKIIKDLSAFFPVKEDQFLVGPLGQITWGAKSILTIDFGLIIEFSKPFRIAIPGVLKAILPNEAEPLVKLQVNFIGIIDFDKKYLSFDASLYNSFIQSFPINGDMALRLTWGDNPFFLLTVGGFHPAYTPPPLNLPVLRRLQIQIADRSDLKLAFKTYFAITSNSVQFGAAVYGYAKAAGFEAEGYFNFDVLFLFSPFRFTAGLAIGVAVKYEGREFLSASLSLKLSGPSPWRAEGVATVAIELLLFTIKARISFDFESGSAALATKERIDVAALLFDALKTKTNWSAYTNNEAMVNVLNWEDTNGTLFVAPNGSLGYMQNVMPANITLEKFGSELPNVLDLNFKNIVVANHTPGNFGVNVSAAKSNFPLGEYINLSDQDKLNASRSFQLLNSGFNLQEPVKLNVPYVNNKLIEYEEYIIDNGNRGDTVSVGINDDVFNQNLKNSAITQNPLSNNYKNVQSAFSKKIVSNPIKYYVANNSNGANIGGNGLAFDSPIEAEIYMKNAIKNDPNLMDNVSILNTLGV